MLTLQVSTDIVKTIENKLLLLLWRRLKSNRHNEYCVEAEFADQGTNDSIHLVGNYILSEGESIAQSKLGEILFFFSLSFSYLKDTNKRRRI